ncbi:hypothetical protein KAR91_08925 [Candidatus Pacearchaeota archaeon]|nr:hypothetical protein [Candidatus Pacearchaeota archaeon]
MDETIVGAAGFGQLYGLTSKGKTKVWGVKVTEFVDGTVSIDQTYGELDGKMQTNRKIVREGKNIGKANETSPFQQACSEAQSKYTKKLEQEGYSEDKDNLRIPKLPMLAQVFDKSKHRLTYPAYVQPKLNGVRCFAEKVSETEVVYTSRKGKAYNTLGHLTPHLLDIMKVGEIWDGEVYNPVMTFQEITSAVKKQREASLDLELWVYDVADSTKGFGERAKRYWNSTQKPGIIRVVTTLVKNEEEVHKYHDEFVQDGFEGIIIRNVGDDGYSFKHRSHNLQKLKNFIDEEFLIVGGYDGKGTSFEGMVTFECLLSNGETFGAVPKGSHEYKRQLWKDLDKIVKAKTLLTVRYQELSDEGTPIFPVGIALRDGEFGYE